MLFKRVNPGYFTKLYRLRWNTLHKLFYSPRRVHTWRKQRVMHGVSEFDCYSFYSYLEAVLANGLDYLVKNKHGVPAQFVSGESLTDAEVAAWEDIIEQARDDAAWLVDYENKSDIIHEEHMGNVKHWFERSDRGYSTWENDATEKQTDEWRQAINKLDIEREVRKNRLLDFVKEHFYSLWD